MFSNSAAEYAMWDAPDSINKDTGRYPQLTPTGVIPAFLAVMMSISLSPINMHSLGLTPKSEISESAAVGSGFAGIPASDPRTIKHIPSGKS